MACDRSYLLGSARLALVAEAYQIDALLERIQLKGLVARLLLLRLLSLLVVFLLVLVLLGDCFGHPTNRWRRWRRGRRTFDRHNHAFTNRIKRRAVVTRRRERHTHLIRRRLRSRRHASSRLHDSPPAAQLTDNRCEIVIRGRLLAQQQAARGRVDERSRVLAPTDRNGTNLQENGIGVL